MLNEPNGTVDEPLSSPAALIQTPPKATDRLRSRLREAVDQVFDVEVEESDTHPPVTATYTRRLKIDSVLAYEQLDAAFKAMDHVPMFAPSGDRHMIRAIRGRFQVRPSSWWPNALLFALTVLALLYTGATMDLGKPDLNSPLDFLRGWPYAVGLILILGSHELGHYFAARHHKVAVTLPYFIPLPFISPFGTMGAFIQLREPMRNRRILLDVGAAGPLAGMIVAIPVLLIGLKTSPVLPSPIADLLTMKTTSAHYFLEGNSLLYAGAKMLVFGHFLPDSLTDVYINQLAQAGWVGLLVTSLNLIPIGQLDGGHTLYSLIGEKARLLYLPTLVILGLLTVLYEGWLIWLVLLLFLGRVYATPLDTITKLDRRRVILALITLAVFILVFMPVPASEILTGR